MTHPRRLIAVDIENLTGTPEPTPADVLSVKGALTGLLEVRPGDLVVIACSHRALLTVGTTWTRVRHVVRSGENGADLALLDVLTGERVQERFEHVVIASGDGIFADEAARLGGRGVHVTVVARGVALSKRLRMAAREVILLDTLSTDLNFQKDIA